MIIGCEIGFWVLLGLGLATRYLWRMRRLSTALLVAVPLLDVILLAAAVIDIRGGAEANWRHGLAAGYLAYSIVFGHRTLRWADQRFAHRFAGGPPPWKPPPGGMARARYEWTMWLRTVLACAIAAVLLYGLAWLVGDWSRTTALLEFGSVLPRIVVIALLWPLSYTFFPKKAGASGAPHASEGPFAPGTAGFNPAPSEGAGVSGEQHRVPGAPHTSEGFSAPGTAGSDPAPSGEASIPHASTPEAAGSKWTPRS
ncbi:hypothetical protein [Streptosporangium saharense]|uniref:Uncharacterized protein n=1 Tax=Streptosporangium saharense TaxID=1706840 RepID=A0A7W7VPD7_9ACTN|nr:hypothetical protein [Streptosporangium saharense]MBB4917399.1 hypothetical protein [Streptosporangium saharense]